MTVLNNVHFQLSIFTFHNLSFQWITKETKMVNWDMSAVWDSTENWLQKIKIYNLKNTVWSLVYFVTVATKWSTKNMSPSIVSRDLGHSITDVWDKLPHSQSGRGINLLRVFVFSASWENLFLVATVRSTDAKKTYCLEANPNPEGYFSFFYFSSKSTLRLLLGGLLCLRM